jgi:hypothetical protein
MGSPENYCAFMVSTSAVILREISAPS